MIKKTKTRIGYYKRLPLKVWLIKHNESILFLYITVLSRWVVMEAALFHEVIHRPSLTEGLLASTCDFHVTLIIKRISFSNRKMNIIQMFTFVCTELRKVVSYYSLYFLRLCDYFPLIIWYFEHLFFFFSCLGEICIYFSFVFKKEWFLDFFFANSIPFLFY